MLYIYGRIFCTIRQRSRNYLGEVSHFSRRRPAQWAARLQTARDKRAAGNKSTKPGPISAPQRPFLVPVPDDVAAAAVAAAEAEAATSASVSVIDADSAQNGHALRFKPSKSGGDKFKWFQPSGQVKKDDMFRAGSKSGASHVFGLFESLTLLEIHEPSTCVRDYGSGITQYANVRVNVEYVAEYDSSPDEEENPVMADNDANQHVEECDIIQVDVQHGSLGLHETETETDSKSNAGVNGGQPSGLISQERKAARQLGVIMCAFIVCWLPYFIVFLVVAVCPSCIGDSLYNTTLWLGYINSTLNPVLYPLCNINFRRAFYKMMTQTCRLSSVKHQTYPVPHHAAPNQVRH